MVEVVMQARSPDIAEWVQQCADGELDFDTLCSRVAALGFKTTSLYEMVISTPKSKEQH